MAPDSARSSDSWLAGAPVAAHLPPRCGGPGVFWVAIVTAMEISELFKTCQTKPRPEGLSFSPEDRAAVLNGKVIAQYELSPDVEKRGSMAIEADVWHWVADVCRWVELSRRFGNLP